MFERFQPDARHAMVRAQHETIRDGRDTIGCEHMLLGLLAEPGPAAAALTAAGLDLAGLRARLPKGPGAGPDPLDADALASVGIDLDAVRRATDAAFGPGALDRPGPARPRRLGWKRLAPEGKKSLELALAAAVSSHHRRITGGHLLIGIIGQGDNPALDLLREAGVDAGALRADVLARITPAA